MTASVQWDVIGLGEFVLVKHSGPQLSPYLHELFTTQYPEWPSKTEFLGWVFDAAAEMPVETPACHVGGVEFWLQFLTEASCQGRAWEAKVMVKMLMCERDLDGVADPWCQPGHIQLLQAIGDWICGWELFLSVSFCVCIHLCLSVAQINNKDMFNPCDCLHILWLLQITQKLPIMRDVSSGWAQSWTFTFISLPLTLVL